MLCTWVLAQTNTYPSFNTLLMKIGATVYLIGVFTNPLLLPDHPSGFRAGECKDGLAG